MFNAHEFAHPPPSFPPPAPLVSTPHAGVSGVQVPPPSLSILSSPHNGQQIPIDRWSETTFAIPCLFHPLF